jgi:hypothetical protein
MNVQSDADDLRGEYDFTPEQLRQGVRGKYAASRSLLGVLATLEPLDEAFPPIPELPTDSVDL